MEDPTTLVGRHVKRDYHELMRDLVAEFWSDWFRPACGKHARRSP